MAYLALIAFVTMLLFYGSLCMGVGASVAKKQPGAAWRFGLMALVIGVVIVFVVIRAYSN